jgi:hypothetical protein
MKFYIYPLGVVDQGAELGTVIYGVERVNVKFAMPRRQPRRRSQWRRDVIPQCHGLWCRARGLFFKIFSKNTLVRIFQKRAKKLKKTFVLFPNRRRTGEDRKGMAACPHGQRKQKEGQTGKAVGKAPGI